MRELKIMILVSVVGLVLVLLGKGNEIEPQITVKGKYIYPYITTETGDLFYYDKLDRSSNGNEIIATVNTNKTVDTIDDTVLKITETEK